MSWRIYLLDVSKWDILLELMGAMECLRAREGTSSDLFKRYRLSTVCSFTGLDQKKLLEILWLGEIFVRLEEWGDWRHVGFQREKEGKLIPKFFTRWLRNTDDEFEKTELRKSPGLRDGENNELGFSCVWITDRMASWKCVFVEGSLARRNQRKRRSPGRQGGAPPGKRAGAGLLLGWEALVFQAPEVRS